MTWFRNLKISMKLLIGFLLMALVAGIVGFVGINQINSVAAADVLLYEQMTVPITHLANINSAFLNIRVSVRDLMIARSSEETQRYRERLIQLEKDIQGYQTEYAKSLIADEEKNVFQKYSNGVKQYFVDLERFNSLLDSGDKTAALSYMRGDFLVVAKEIDAALLKMRESKITLARDASLSNGKLSQKAITKMSVFMIIGIALAAAFGFWIAAIVGKPLRKMTEICNQLAVGNMEQTVELASKDEVGMLAQAFKKIIDSQKELTGIAIRIAEGDLDVDIKARSEKDLLGKAMQRVLSSLDGLVKETIILTESAADGQLAKRGDSGKFKGGYKAIVEGVNNTLDTVIGPINETISILEKIAARDMSARITGNYKGDFARLKEVLNKAIHNLNEALIQVVGGSEQVASAAVEISKGSQSLSQAASEQASSLEEISSSMQEMSSMTKQNSNNSKEARKLTEGAMSSSLKGVESMERLSAAIDNIKESSDATAKIIKTIDEIAFQTNLLALNAAVEAARAGDAGKGFAVVAEEVRNLAMRSADAAKNTASLIEESVKKAEGGVAVNQEVLVSLHDIKDQINKVTVVMSEIAAASDQQSQGVEQINKAIDQMNQVTQQTAANAEESASAAEELASQASEMQSMVREFHLTKTVISNVNNDPSFTEKSQYHQPPKLKAGTIAKQQRTFKGMNGAPKQSWELIPLNEAEQRELDEF